MESTPSSRSESPTPLIRRTNPALAVRSWPASRRVRTFGLGALCGALALSLVVVVTSIFAASGDRPPLLPEPAPASDVRVTPRPTPSSTPSMLAPQPEVVATPEAEEPAPEEGPIEPVVVPAADEPVEDAPGNSGSAPGRTKPPKSP
jgi:hypothetical protein